MIIFEVLQEDLKTLRTITYINQDGVKKESYCCPYCNKNDGGLRIDNICDDINSLKEHMGICQDNPRYIEYKRNCDYEYNRLFSDFGILSDDCRLPANISTKLKTPIVCLTSGFYHKSISDPDNETLHFTILTHETDEAYLGYYILGIKMHHVIFPKKYNTNIRSLNPTERIKIDIITGDKTKNYGTK